MARICPLCGESVETGTKFPHICKAIPMPTIGQCSECGTALSELNVSDLYPDLCKECHRKIPGNASESVVILRGRGRLIVVEMGGWHYLRYYVVHNDRMALDLLRRTWGGRIIRHRGRSYKWAASRRVEVAAIAKAMESYNPMMTRWVLRWCHAPTTAGRSVIAEELMEAYDGKCLRMHAQPAAGKQ